MVCINSVVHALYFTTQQYWAEICVKWQPLKAKDKSKVSLFYSNLSIKYPISLFFILKFYQIVGGTANWRMFDFAQKYDSEI